MPNIVSREEENMEYQDEQDKRIAALFSEEDTPEVNEKNLEIYLDYIKTHLKLPCQLKGVEVFTWEEPYLLGGWSRAEYKELKKKKPSYSDVFDLLDFNEDIPTHYGILVSVRRVSDRKKFTLPLADLEAIDGKSENYRILDDYSVWLINY